MAAHAGVRLGSSTSSGMQGITYRNTTTSQQTTTTTATTTTASPPVPHRRPREREPRRVSPLPSWNHLRNQPP